MKVESVASEKSVTPGESVHRIGVGQHEGGYSLRKSGFPLCGGHLFQLPFVGSQLRFVSAVTFTAGEAKRHGDHH